MIPQRLVLENFMAYAQAELDFSSFQVACLAGNNGAGKSTILDALTWVLFDQARAQDSEDLIRLGAAETRVELSFKLEGQEYRVIRSRKRKGKGKSSGKASLEFQILAEQGYRSLSGKKIQETQQLIEKTLHMNYELFVNSSFILQGRADAFTTATPAQRKAVLADILQLEAYEKLRQQAQEQKKAWRLQEQLIRAEINQHQADLAALEHLQAHLKDSEAHQQELENRHQQLQQRYKALQQSLEDLRLTRYEYEHLSQEQQQTQQSKEQLLSRRQTLEPQLEKVQGWLDHQQQIEAAYASLNSLEAELLSLEAPYQAYLEAESKLQQQIQASERSRHQLDLARQQAGFALQSLQQQLKGLEAILPQQSQIEQHYQLWQQANAQEQALLSLQQDWLAAERSLEQNRLEQTQLKQTRLLQQTQLSQRQQELQSELAKQSELEAEYQQLQAEIERLQDQQTKLEQVQQRGLELKHEQEQLKQQISQHQSEIQRIRQRMQELEAQRDTVCPLCERLLSTAELSLLLEKYQQESQQHQQEIEALQPQIEQFEKQILEKRRDYQQLSREVKALQGQQTRLGTLQASLQHLSQAAHKYQQLSAELAQLEADAQQRQAELAAAQIALQTRQAQLNFQPDSLQQLQEQLKELRSAEARYQQLQQALSQIPELKERILAAQASYQELESQAQTQSTQQQAELERLEQEIEPLRQIPETRQRLQSQLEPLRGAQERYQHLQSAKARFENLSQQQQEFGQQLAALESQSQQLAAELSRKALALGPWEALQSQQQALEAQLESDLEQQKQLHAEIYSLQKELQGLLEREGQCLALEAKASDLLYEIQLYEVLEESFSKNGLQAVLIENALPEIEQLANEMLSSMSDGRMHIKLQTLRSYKTRDKLAETLDILISDELGTRSYETFSAGEAFRVNFALRLAISKLLARRAGARLQTLVIDEGFGTQDQQGKTRLIEALNAVAADFATILVITHVDELKALFSCRIEVHKQAEGSSFKVLHV